MRITVVELPGYMKDSERLLGEEENRELIGYLSLNPKAGDLIQGTGGVRKLRWKRPGMGKRGGVRAIYYFHDENIPLFMLTLFGKGEKENLKASEKRGLSLLVKELVQEYRRSK